jgi:hypothetical protein
MNSHESNQPARAEALEQAFPMSSADRARFWSRRTTDAHE